MCNRSSTQKQAYICHDAMSNYYSELKIYKVSKVSLMVCMLFFCQLSYYATSCGAFGYIPVYSETKDWFDDQVEDTSQSIGTGLGQGAGAALRQEFKKAMDHLFDEKVKPLLLDIDVVLANRLDQMDSIADNRLGQVDNIARERLDQANDIARQRLEHLKEVIERVSGKIQRDTSVTIKKIREEIIERAANQIENLRKGFRKDIDHVFDRAELWVKSIDCTEEKVKVDFIIMAEEIKNAFDIWTKLGFKKLPPCYLKYGIKKPPSWWQYSKLYRIEKCQALQELNEKSSVISILDLYLDLQVLSARMACIQRWSEHAEGHFSMDWLQFRRKYKLWKETQKW